MNAILKELTALSPWGTVLDSGEADGPPRNPCDIIEQIGKALPAVDSQERARLRHRLGYLALAHGDVRSKAIEAFTLMREGAVKVGDRHLEALAECGLAAAYDFIGERHESLKHALAARSLAEELNDRRLLAIALNEEAQFYKENGENPRAQELYRQIEAIGTELSDDRLVLTAYIGLGRTTRMDKAAVGIAHYEAAIEKARSLGDEAALALCYNNLSDWMIYTGRYQEAIQLRAEMLRLAQKWGMKPHIGRALIGQAKAYTLMGETAKARELLNKGFPTVVSIGDLEGDLHSALNLAYLYVQNGDTPRAVDLYRQTLERSLAAPDHACAVFAQRALELLADGTMPAPGILPQESDLNEELSDTELEGVVGGGTLRPIYATGDMPDHVGP